MSIRRSGVNKMIETLVRKFMADSYYYRKNLLGEDSRYTLFQKRGPEGAVLHSVGCNIDKALDAIAHWNRMDFTAASIHGFIDAHSGILYQTMPWNFRAPHCGGALNDTHVGIEMCEPPRSVMYYPDPDHSSRIVVVDMEKARAMVTLTYLSAVEQFANLTIQFGWDPMKPGVILSHAEGYKLGKASNHGDPEHLWNQLGLGFTMDTFRQAVANRVKEKLKPVKEPTGDKHSKYADAATTWATEKKLFQGDGAGNFDWMLQMDREQAATILYRYAELCGMDVTGHVDMSGYSDAGKVSGYAVEPIAWAIGTGLIKGVTKTTLDPKGACTRGQWVTMLHRMYGLPKVNEAAEIFTDVAGSAYYSEAVMWAAVNEVVNGVGEGKFEPDEIVTREQAAATLYRLMTGCEMPRV